MTATRRKWTWLRCLLTSGWMAIAAAAQADGPHVAVSPATKQPDGVCVHSVNSPFQSGETKIRVLLPDKIAADRKYRVLYLLPVEPADEHRYGDGLQAAMKADLHNRHDVIFVAPTFSQLPWYADHPTDPAIRQETYLLRVVVPFVDGNYPVRAEPEGRFAVGFSKSGWGAFTLLLRHPDIFGRAAAWDAPLMKDKPDQFGMGPIFGTQENFEQYQVTSLLRQQADRLSKSRRLVLIGYGNFRQHHQQIHQLMQRQNILCDYRDGPQRKHVWNSGWLPEAVELLMSAESPR